MAGLRLQRHRHLHVQRDPAGNPRSHPCKRRRPSKQPRWLVRPPHALAHSRSRLVGIRLLLHFRTGLLHSGADPAPQEDLHQALIASAGEAVFTGRNSQLSRNANSTPPSVKCIHVGAFDGEKKPSIHPATTSMGTMPETSRAASTPPRATESFHRSAPGNSMECPRRNPAPPAMMMAGSSSDPWPATKLHNGTDIPY